MIHHDHSEITNKYTKVNGTQRNMTESTCTYTT